MPTDWVCGFFFAFSLIPSSGGGLILFQVHMTELYFLPPTGIISQSDAVFCEHYSYPTDRLFFILHSGLIWFMSQLPKCIDVRALPTPSHPASCILDSSFLGPSVLLTAFYAFCSVFFFCFPESCHLWGQRSWEKEEGPSFFLKKQEYNVCVSLGGSVFSIYSLKWCVHPSHLV